jgi:short-chain fatty acids transporter
MDRILNAYARAFQRWMPSPLAIAVLLTGLAGGLAWNMAGWQSALSAWMQGLWNPGLLRFGFQAMFMLVLGHVFALAPSVLKALNYAVGWIIRIPAWAAPKLALLAMGLGWLNWGLGLVGGAILVRGVLDAMRANPSLKGLHPGVLGAAGYTGLLVWHGGLSGSAPLKVAEHGHLSELAPGLSGLPDAIGLKSTVFANWSLSVTWAVVVITVLLFAWLGRRVSSEGAEIPPGEAPSSTVEKSEVNGWGERLDHGRVLPYALGLVILLGAGWGAFSSGDWTELRFITPDWINTVLLGAALWAHGSVKGFLDALDEAIRGAAGILVQFPLYFGIMGLVTGTGLGAWMADVLVGSTSRSALPLALFTSSGLLNIFVPSGGGQWAVQGPLVIQACQNLSLPLEQGIMAMAFGDELTNMLQPFWALPLLGITGLKARDILPYTLLVMLFAGLVMATGMLFWP